MTFEKRQGAAPSEKCKTWTLVQTWHGGHNLQITKLELSVHNTGEILHSVVLSEQLSGAHLWHGKLLTCSYPDNFQFFVDCCLQLISSTHSSHSPYHACQRWKILLHKNIDGIDPLFFRLACVFSGKTAYTVSRLSEHSHLTEHT